MSLATYSEVYRTLLEHCRPHVLAEPWKRLPAAPGMHRAPADAAALAASLRRQFPDELLWESGVAARGSDGSFGLRPGLATPGAILLPLCRNSNDPPFDILFDGGCVSGQKWPILAVLEDGRYQATLKARNGLLGVAFSMADVAVLWAAGIPTTLATGLESLGGESLDAFCRRFGLKRIRLYAPKPTPPEPSAAPKSQATATRTESPSSTAPPVAAPIVEMPAIPQPAATPVQDGTLSSAAARAPNPAAPSTASPGKQHAPAPPFAKPFLRVARTTERPAANGANESPGSKPNEGRGGKSKLKPPEIVLIGWSPAQLSPETPSALAPVIDQLTRLERHLRIPMEALSLWNVREAELERLQFSLKYGNAGDVLETLLDSAERTATSLVLAAPKGPCPTASETGPGLPVDDPPDRRESERSASMNEGRKSPVEGDFAIPLLEPAARDGDAIQHNLMAVSAALGRLLQSQTRRLLAKPPVAARRDEGHEDASLPSAALRQLLATADRILQCAKELRTCPSSATRRRREPSSVRR